MLPVLRSDLALCENYTYSPVPPLRCGISAFGGLLDRSVAPSKIVPWHDRTSSSFIMRMVPGDHFFLRSAGALLRQYISEDIARVGCAA
jgi:surfactin synthase thioesterase subunit